MTTKTIRIELTVDDDDVWPGDDAACDAALSHVPSGVIELGDDRALMIRSMTASVIAISEPN